MWLQRPSTKTTIWTKLSAKSKLLHLELSENLFDASCLLENLLNLKEQLAEVKRSAGEERRVLDSCCKVPFKLFIDVFYGRKKEPSYESARSRHINPLPPSNLLS